MEQLLRGEKNGDVVQIKKFLDMGKTEVKDQLQKNERHKEIDINKPPKKNEINMSKKNKK